MAKEKYTARRNTGSSEPRNQLHTKSARRKADKLYGDSNSVHYRKEAAKRKKQEAQEKKEKVEAEKKKAAVLEAAKLMDASTKRRMEKAAAEADASVDAMEVSDGEDTGHIRRGGGLIR